jgi:cell division septal protein FtsQ
MKLYTLKKKKKKFPRRILAITVLFLILFVLFKLTSFSVNKFKNWSFFKVKNIEIVCEPPLKSDEIALISDIRKGTNIFYSKLRRAKEIIKQNPWVDKVRTKRSFPDTIKINITNKIVRLMSRENDKVYYVDRKGKIIDSLKPGLIFDVPIVETKNLSYLEAINIIDRINKSGWINENEISEIFINKDFVLIYPSERETKIHLNTNNIEQGLVNVEKVIKDLEKRGENALLIDASISNNRIFVKNLQRKP